MIKGGENFYNGVLFFDYEEKKIQNNTGKHSGVIVINKRILAELPILLAEPKNHVDSLLAELQKFGEKKKPLWID